MCRNSPHGDNWPTWQTDFFAPGRPLLEIAPWIVARDNYERATVLVMAGRAF
jgi:hypothetical protein